MKMIPPALLYFPLLSSGRPFSRAVACGLPLAGCGFNPPAVPHSRAFSPPPAFSAPKAVTAATRRAFAASTAAENPIR